MTTTPAPTWTLRCAVVGQRTVVTVEAKSDLSVSDFKHVVLDKRPLGFPTIMLVFFLAKPRGVPQPGWLKTTDEDYEALARNDAQTADMYLNERTKMDALERLAHYFQDQPDDHPQAIHMLIELPTQEQMLAVFGGWYSPIPPKTPAQEREELSKQRAPPLLPPPPEPMASWISRVVCESVASWTTWSTTEDTKDPEKTEESEETYKTC